MFTVRIVKPVLVHKRHMSSGELFKGTNILVSLFDTYHWASVT